MTLASTPAGRIERHKFVDRAYHWLMAIAMLILLATAFLPILGIKFEWVGIHWVTGLVLTTAVLFHMIRASIWQKFRAMVPDGQDLRDPLAKPGKYSVAQKLYHLAISILILSAIASGLLMWRKVDTPFWKRDPYWLSTDAWGVVYAIHGLAAMALVTMVIIHVYFALRPDEWHLTRSMLRGWITPKEYTDHFEFPPVAVRGRALNRASFRNFSKRMNPMQLGEAIDAVEGTYEFMLAYAAQGRRQEDDDATGGIRASLEQADAGLAAIGAATVGGAEAGAFLEIVRQDAAKASAAIRLVLAQPVINSQLIDNLNASIHLRALLTDLFLLDEALKINPA